MTPEVLSVAYPWLFRLHVACVIISVTLFAARGAGVLSGASWPMKARWRRSSVWIDVLLLGAGSGLWLILQLSPTRDLWLGIKLILLVVYVVLGSFALKRAPTRRARALFFVAALACVAFMASIAITHHPAGWLS